MSSPKDMGRWARRPAWCISSSKNSSSSSALGSGCAVLLTFRNSGVRIEKRRLLVGLSDIPIGHKPERCHFTLSLARPHNTYCLGRLCLGLPSARSFAKVNMAGYLRDGAIEVVGHQASAVRKEIGEASHSRSGTVTADSTV